jgi:hypothetical protein
MLVALYAHLADVLVVSADLFDLAYDAGFALVGQQIGAVRCPDPLDRIGLLLRIGLNVGERDETALDLLGDFPEKRFLGVEAPA